MTPSVKSAARDRVKQVPIFRGMRSGDGDDSLQGNLGNDFLYGGDGADMITGGAGRDAMTGGDGADVFATISQSSATPEFADNSLDFTQGDDRIGLSGIGNLTFLGAVAFTHVAGQVRYALSGTNKLIQIDLNGDGSADSLIRLAGNVALTAHDFIL